MVLLTKMVIIVGVAKVPFLKISTVSKLIRKSRIIDTHETVVD